MAPHAARAIQAGTIYCDDNRSRIASFPSESVDLIYLDPPFFSNRKYEVIWGDEAELRSFEDRWEGGIAVYIAWMKDRLIELHRVLKPSGSLYLHCDPAASHHLKLLMDSVFGSNSFRSEIVWRRTSAHSDAARNYAAVHDLILFYTKGKTWTWNRQYEPYTSDYIDTHFVHKDSDGRLFRRVDLRSPSYRANLVYDYKGYKPHANGWVVSLEKMEQLDAEGRLFFPAKGTSGRIRRKLYLEESLGVPITDVWTDIKPIFSTGSERLGYPTQKPIALLDRIIQASSNPGDLVLDPFCGCGTTLASAAQLGRRWVGVDISPTACDLIKRRLAKQGIEVQVENMPASEAALRGLKPFEFQNWAIAAMNGTHSPRKTGDMGIDGFTWFEHLPVQVKQSDFVGREVVDKFETAVERNGTTRGGVIVAFSFTRGAREEVARVRATKGIEIRLMEVGDLLERSDPDATRDYPIHSRPVVVPDAAALVESIRRGLSATIEEEDAASPEGPRPLPATKRGRRVPQPLQGSGDTD